ncbi:UNVERIFIED_CONTAM: hypothetical protein FKN15_030313 [Acipenser sinensis]
MMLCLLLAWIICYFCVWKGVKSTGKVVYFTATFPYLMLVVLLIRGLTLPGAMDGIIFYLYPDPARLADPQGLRVPVPAEQRNKLCGRVRHLLSAGLHGVRAGSPGLAFIAYPRAVAMMPLPQLLACCFFLMVILLGLDSQFVGLKSLTTAISDMRPALFQQGSSRKLLLLFICVSCFFVGLLMVTEGGLYLFQLFDYYTCSGICLLFLSIVQCVCVAWVYGADRFYDCIEDMIGYRPWPLIKYCWLFFTPVICTGTFIFSLVKYTPLKYKGTYEYPAWGYILGWFLALSSMVLVPLWIVFKLTRTKGTIREVQSH